PYEIARKTTTLLRLPPSSSDPRPEAPTPSILDGQTEHEPTTPAICFLRPQGSVHPPQPPPRERRYPVGQRKYRSTLSRSERSVRLRPARAQTETLTRRNEWRAHPVRRRDPRPERTGAQREEPLPPKRREASSLA